MRKKKYRCFVSKIQPQLFKKALLFKKKRKLVDKHILSVRVKIHKMEKFP